MNRHIKNVHTGNENKPQCPHCDKYCMDKWQLHVHIDLMHQELGGEINHICSECGDGFIHSYSLTKHLYDYHSGKNNKSSKRKRVSNKYSLKNKHEITQCKFCGKRCTNLQLSKHIRMVHPKEFFEQCSDSELNLCSKCDRKFASDRGKIVYFF